MAEDEGLTLRRLLAALIIFALLPGLALARDARWAKPLILDGVPNLHQVSATLYRSAQPTAAGFKNLETQYHIATDLDLRLDHSDAPLLAGTHISAKAVPMSTFMSNDDVIKALRLLVAAEAKGPVLVHCQRGADRTGVVIAMYRVVVQGWSKEEAIAEMQKGGFAFDPLLLNIPWLIQHADVAAYRAALAKAP
ncbi:MAG: tyrosine-protein phosphatase [Alphaproteobacteria bacterium]|nr:tyrosine-protein phosphatase [Alphaproteobacteria bacterium]